MTHSAKLCTERPRKLGAKWTGRDIKADEVISNIDLDWDGKRDRWNGYDPSTHAVVVDQYEKIEQERRKMKKEEEMKKFSESDATQQKNPSAKEGETKEPAKVVDDDSSDDSDEDVNEDDFKTKEEGSLEIKKDPKTRTTVRNLRIREDTAKYLRNLSIDSAYYDPKSRSMRENPNPDVNAEEALYAGDNFVRKSGDVQKFYDAQKFAWQADMTSANSVHLQAAPSAFELLYKKHNTEVEESAKKLKQELLAKYGGQEYLASKETKVLAQTEEYVEYTPQGIRKSNEKGVVRSRYEEDVYPGNHSSVWGSFWASGRWGYACCRQFVKNSYCTGKSGIVAQEEIKKDIDRKREVTHEAKTDSPPPKKKESKDSKRGFDALQYGTDVDEKELEEYKQKKLRSDDPMKDFVKSS